MKTRKLK